MERFEIVVVRGMYDNSTKGPWRAEYESPCGRLISERGHTEDEARERLLDALRRLHA